MEIKESRRADYTPTAHILPLGQRNWGEGSEGKVEGKKGYLIQVRPGLLRLYNAGHNTERRALTRAIFVYLSC